MSTLSATAATRLPVSLALGGLVILTSAGLLLTDSLLVPLVLAAVSFAVYFLSTESRSITAFILMDFVLAYRGRWQSDAEGSGLETAIGVMMLAIIGLWIVRIRFLENSPLSHDRSMLAMVMFFVWSVIVTVPPLYLDHHTADAALRELLNLAPLLILPVLYYRGIESGDIVETRILQLVILGGVVIVFRSLYVLKSSVVKAYYLFQTGRGSNDALLAVFLVLIAVSFLMTKKSVRDRLLYILLLIVGLVGVVACFSRAIYLGCLVAVLIVIVLGMGKERLRGIRGSLVSISLLVAAAAPIVLQTRILRLMVMRYGGRFASSTHVTTDKALLSRYVEWGYLWDAIKESPLLGHGFGAQFHMYDILLQQHSWMSFSHSSYLYLLFKSGIVGAMLFFYAFTAFIVLGVRLSRNRSLPDGARAVVRAGLGMMIAFLLDAYAAPDLDSKLDLIWIGLIWGYFLVLSRKYMPEIVEYRSLLLFKRWKQPVTISHT
jgi:O-antigen ligase